MYFCFIALNQNKIRSPLFDYAYIFVKLTVVITLNSNKMLKFYVILG